jgi:hypothetical protein
MHTTFVVGDESSYVSTLSSTHVIYMLDSLTSEGEASPLKCGHKRTQIALE